MSETEHLVKPRTERLIARRMAVGFGLVSVVAIAMCAALISLIAQVSGLVQEMEDDEAAIKASMALAASIREQYIHQAHWIVERDDAHLEHYQEWVERIATKARALAPLVPASERDRLEGVAEASRELDELFRTEIVPAARAGDRERLVSLHRSADAITGRATRNADAIARAVEARMARAHRSATRFTQVGLLSGAGCVIIVLALSIMFTLRLQRAVLKPLDLLVRAANRFGAGEFGSRVGKVGEGEFQDVARAFDGMAEELEARETRIIRGERMAAIGQLAAGVAHEINNPIQVIRGYLKTMGPDTAAETLREELAILDEEAAACQRIAEDLVAYSRSPDLERKKTDIAELLRETARRFRETPQGREHRVDVDVEDAELLLDGQRMRQVVVNLLINAAQVSGSDEPIELRSRREGDAQYLIDVTDCGPGIEAADKARVFEPFFSKRSGGSGLGLAVCSGIVRAHGGTITVADRLGGGTTMRVAIPLAGKETST